jgi:hypothetical protein
MGLVSKPVVAEVVAIFVGPVKLMEHGSGTDPGWGGGS